MLTLVKSRGLKINTSGGGQDSSLPAVAMCLNAGAMGRQDAESETLIPTTGGGFDVAGTLKANNGGGGFGSDPSETFIPIAFDSKGTHVQTDETGAVPTLRSMNHDKSHQNGGGQLAVAFDTRNGMAPHGSMARDIISPTLRAKEHEPPMVLQADVVGFAQNQRDELRLMDVAGALAAEPGMKQQTYIQQSWAVRRLTPIECERLQGFPDGYTDIPPLNKNHTPDGPRYKQLGNSMAVNVMRWIGRRIEMVEQIA